jgi:hypothetical protein
MQWKDTVVKFYALKQHSLTFKGNVFDFAYISDKKAVGIITEILGDNYFTIAFFPSMKNDQTFVASVKFNREADFIIPRYESLLKFGNYIVQKEIELERTVDIVDGKFSDGKINKYKFHEKLAEMYKINGDGASEYDTILQFICQWLGLENIYE